MFGFSLSELFVVFLVFIIFVRPEDLPGLVRSLNQIKKRLKTWLAEGNSEYRKFKDSLKDDGFFEDIDEIDAEVKEILGDDNKVYKAYDFSEVERQIAESNKKDEEKSE